jgi:hypothetical protein
MRVPHSVVRKADYQINSTTKFSVKQIVFRLVDVQLVLVSLFASV